MTLHDDYQRQRRRRMVGGPVETRIGALSMANTGIPASAARRATVHVYAGTDGRDMLYNSPDGWEVDHPELWFDGPAGGNGTGGPIGTPPPGAWRRRGWPSAWTRAESILCDGLAGMPWQTFQGTSRISSPPWITDPQLKRPDLRIASGPVPDWRKSAVEFRAAGIRSMKLYGEWILYVPVRNADGTPAPPIWQLHPWRVAIDSDGQWIIPPAPGPDRWTSNGYVFQPGELIVIRNKSLDGPRGIGILEENWPDLELAQLQGDFAGQLFRDGIPNGYLKVNAPQLTEDAALDLQKRWMAAHGGRNKKIAVLNATTDFTPLNIPDTVTSQLSDLKNMSNLDIALMWGLPPYFLGVTISGDTYANVTSRLVELVELGYLPEARKIESVFDAELPMGTSVRINLDSLRRADTTTRYQAYAIGIQAGFLDTAEVRALENLPPLPAPVPPPGPQPPVPPEQVAAPSADAEAALEATPAPVDDSEEIAQ